MRGERRAQCGARWAKAQRRARTEQGAFLLRFRQGVYEGARDLHLLLGRLRARGPRAKAVAHAPLAVVVFVVAALAAATAKAHAGGAAHAQDGCDGHKDDGQLNGD
jgi:hypothetical protein